MLNSIRERVLDRELLTGTFLNLGSSLTVEMAGRSGFD
ncbi:MAG: 2-dehydro-3-deoxyglucarate aldolase, partial [Candidatus Latescibacteria bacterium]|nr:2-dehydro-3-deoxyglucarate aldolase [Candidatus Latescibacterota bacterium]